MMRWLSAPCLFVAVAGLSIAGDKKEAADKDVAKIQVTRLEVRKPPPQKAGGPFQMSDGITLAIMVSPPGKHVTGVDVKASKLDSLTDDKKNNLYKKPAFSFGGADWLSEFAQYSPDGDSVTVLVSANKTPGSGASKVLLKASLVLNCGTDEKATDKKEIALKPKEEIALGSFKVQISPFSANQVLVISDKENIKNVEFFDDKGKKLMLGAASRLFAPPGANKKTQYTYSYFLFQKMEKVSVKINYFDKVEKATVPLDLRVGVGLD